MKDDCRGGEPERMEPDELGRLIDRNAAALELYARQWADAPEDVVQEAFVALASLDEPPRTPEAWLFRAVRNGAINAGIAGRRRRRREAEAAGEAPSWFVPGDDQGIDPEAAREALSGLPDDQREVIVARLWGALTFEQIAGVTGTSASSAHRAFHAGLTTLRERLGVSCPATSSRTTPTRA